MKTAKTLWIVILLGVFALPAMADHDDHRYSAFERRLDRQHERIQSGVRSGALTPKEAKRLRKQQRHIAKLERRFERDGHFDRYERRTLKSELDLASHRIYRLKHNDRFRGRHGGKRRGYDEHDHHRGHHYGRRYGHDHHDRYVTSERVLGDSGWSVVLGLWEQW